MGIAEKILNIGNTKSSKPQYVINIESEIWLAFAREILHWNDRDIYVVSFFVDFDLDNQKDVRLHFGYNTESQYKHEQCYDIDNETIRWNYNFWLQNETFCFGEDDITDGLIKYWIKQEKLTEENTVEELVKKIVCAVREIHKCGILKKKFGSELPIIIHTKNYYEGIAAVNIDANGEYLNPGFVEYCLRDFEE